MYRRTVREHGTSLNWIKIKIITDTSDRKVVVNFEKGKEYELVVTATNSFGEGGKEDSIQWLYNTWHPFVAKCLYFTFAQCYTVYTQNKREGVY